MDILQESQYSTGIVRPHKVCLATTKDTNRHDLDGNLLDQGLLPAK